MVLEWAVADEADVIATGDRKHLLPREAYEGIPIVSPADVCVILDNRYVLHGPVLGYRLTWPI
jgi:predicted nucleic acid-binding protein